VHLCVRCNKKIENFCEFEKGCGCGSRVFIFMKDGEEPAEIKWIDQNIEEFQVLNERADAENKNIVLDVENVRMVDKGIYHLNLESLLENPVVIRDLNDVYYIKLPEPQLKAKTNPKSTTRNHCGSELRVPSSETRNP